MSLVLSWMSFYYELSWAQALYHHPWEYLWVALLALVCTEEKHRPYLVFIASFLVFYTNLFLIAVPFWSLVLIPHGERKKNFFLISASAFLGFLLFYVQRVLFFGSWLGPWTDILTQAFYRYQSFENFLPIFWGYISSYFGPWMIYLFLFFSAELS